ncbi:hypothetical protein D3C86_2262430 [compost metagenome]
MSYRQRWHAGVLPGHLEGGRQGRAGGGQLIRKAHAQGLLAIELVGTQHQLTGLTTADALGQ